MVTPRERPTVNLKLVTSHRIAEQTDPVGSRGFGSRCRLGKVLSVGGARALRCLACCLGMMMPVQSFASHQIPYQPTLVERLYGDLHYAYGGVAHSDLEFNPSFLSLSGGVWLLRGIGIEVYTDRALNESRQGNFELEWTRTSGFAARFQSPDRQGFFAYVLLGMAYTHLEQFESDSRGERTVVQNYEGGRLSIGFGQKYRSIPGMVIVGEYRNYFVDESLNLDALSVGLRFDLQ